MVGPFLYIHLFLFIYLLPASISLFPPLLSLSFFLSMSLEFVIVHSGIRKMKSQQDCSLTPRISDTKTLLEKG